VPNPAYSEIKKKQFEEIEQEYPIPEKIEDVQYTIVKIDGNPEIVNKISDLVFSNFDEVE